jgi:hypothetical protein
MTVIHTAYVTIKMSGLKGIITLKSDQCDALACESAALTHVGRFGEKEVQELAAKMAKTHGASTPVRTVAPKPPTDGTPRPPAEKSTFVGSMSNHPVADQLTDDKKGATRRFWWTPMTSTRSFVLARTSTPNRNSRSSLFSEKIWTSSCDRYQICPRSPGR